VTQSHLVKPELIESASTPATIKGEYDGHPSASDIVKREVDNISYSEDTATPSPSPAKYRKVATAKAGARAKGSATGNRAPGSKASASPSKQQNSIPGGFTGDQKAAMIEEILVAGMSALGVRNIATKVRHGLYVQRQ
jgi:hypothetical protein